MLRFENFLKYVKSVSEALCFNMGERRKTGFVEKIGFGGLEERFFFIFNATKSENTQRSTDSVIYGHSWYMSCKSFINEVEKMSAKLFFAVLVFFFLSTKIITTAKMLSIGKSHVPCVIVRWVKCAERSGSL